MPGWHSFGMAFGCHPFWPVKMGDENMFDGPTSVGTSLIKLVGVSKQYTVTYVQYINRNYTVVYGI